MEQLPEFASGGWMGGLAALGTTAVAAFIYLRRTLSTDNAQIDTIERYRVLLDEEREERQRLIQVMQTREQEWREAMKTISELRAELSGVKEQVRYQTETIERLTRRLGGPASNHEGFK